MIGLYINVQLPAQINDTYKEDLSFVSTLESEVNKKKR